MDDFFKFKEISFQFIRINRMISAQKISVYSVLHCHLDLLYNIIHENRCLISILIGLGQDSRLMYIIH